MDKTVRAIIEALIAEAKDADERAWGEVEAWECVSIAVKAAIRAGADWRALAEIEGVDRGWPDPDEWRAIAPPEART